MSYALKRTYSISERSLPQPAQSRRICEHKCGWPSLSDDERLVQRRAAHWLLLLLLFSTSRRNQKGAGAVSGSKQRLVGGGAVGADRTCSKHSERAMQNSDDPTLQALRLRAVHLMSAASRAAARVEVATAHHKAAALRSGAVKGQVGKCDEWADAVTNESVTRSSEESARRVALGSARAARGATARAGAIEDHMQVRQSRENRLAIKQQHIRDRQVAAVEQARIRSAQTMRWAGMCHAEEEAQVAWRWKLHEQKARDKRRGEAAVQREAAAATRTAVLIQERTRRIEKRLVASHDADNDGTLNAAEYQQLVAGVAGDGRMDAGDFQRILA